MERELGSVKRDHAKLVDAIIAGVPPEQVKDRMIALDARRREIEDQLARSEQPSPVRFHPTMSATYRDRIRALIQNLGDLERADEARDAIRSLIEKIVLTPDANGLGLTVDLHGALAALLRLATGLPAHQAKGGAQMQKAPDGGSEAFDIVEELVLAAGAGFGLCRTSVSLSEARYQLSDFKLRAG